RNLSRRVSRGAARPTGSGQRIRHERHARVRPHPLSTDDALRAARHRQQLAGARESDGARVDHRSRRCREGRAGRGQEHLQHVLLHPDRGADLSRDHERVESRADGARAPLFDRRAARRTLTYASERQAMIQIFAEYWRPFLYSDGMRASGLVVTLWLLAASIVLGFCAAVPLACARVSRNRWLSTPVRIYTYV